MKIEELQKFINEHKIPKIKDKPKTFLGIAKQPHYENVLSNIYAFYFNINEVHKLKDLFIVSLQELISETAIGEKKDLSFQDDFEIETEVTTKKGGRIDLLLTSENEAIIIENKVYHTLNNDLVDYWDSVKGLSQNKIGIVLSLHPIPITGHKHFINITHIQLLNKVMEKVGAYILTANDKYLVFLKDVYQNITNLSKSYMEEKDLEFYFKNQQKINQIAKFKFSVRDHIANEVEKVCDTSNDGFKLYKSKGNLNKRLRYFLSPQNNELMITIVYDGLLTADKNMHIMVELKGATLKNKSQYNTIDFSSEEKEILVEGFENNPNNSWAHFAAVPYILEEHEILNLSGFIHEKLEDDNLLSVYRKLNDYLLAKKKEKELVG